MQPGSIQTNKGKVTFRWLGQMGLLIETGTSKICIDYFASPVDGRQTPPPVPADRLTGINMFIGTHDHIDHMDHNAGNDQCQDNDDQKVCLLQTPHSQPPLTVQLG